MMQTSTFPTPQTAPQQPLLPDPFLRPDGSRLTRPDQWPAQRAYLLSLVNHYLYGAIPPPPENLTAKVVSDTLQIQFTVEGRPYAMECAYAQPEGPGPFPFVVLCGQQPGLAPWLRRAGYGLVCVDYEALAPDSDAYATGLCGQAYPGYDWRALAMWAWGMSRAADALLALGLSDPKGLVAAGFSRCGKAALCAAVQDARFAACIPVSSGCGGAGLFRVIGDRYGLRRPEAETLGSMTMRYRYWYWLSDEVAAFGNHAEDFALGDEQRLPFDLHFLQALVAPRPLLVAGALDDGLWGNPLGTAVAWRAAAEVYRFLGAPGHIGLHFREGGHAFLEEDWAAMTDFIDVTLRGRVARHAWKTLADPSDPNFSDPLRYTDWQAPQA